VVYRKERMSGMVSNIVFTRNRPLQLEAYLESLYKYLSPQLIQTYIIYRMDLFNQQYCELFERFTGCTVVREQNFHDDFVSLMEKIDSKYILFGTDDVVYYDSVSFAVIDAAFEKFPHDIFGFSLRLGPQGLADGK